MSTETDLTLDVRPGKTALIANVSAAVALIVFVVVALVMKQDSAGAYFGGKDQIGTVVLGVLVAAGLRIPARPRMRADGDAVYLKGYLGNWRTIPWDAIVAVEFPKSTRFAQLRLAADERLAVYAIQRLDGERAVASMRTLREIFAATHPDPAAKTD